MNYSTIVIGCQGLVGKAFWNFYRNLNPDSIGTHYVERKDTLLLNLENPQLESLDIPWNSYHYGMIAAALPRIGICEKEKKRTREINLQGALKIGREFAKRGITPIFFSTDYVFDGREGKYDETSSQNPLNEYGKQKAELERTIPEIFGNDYLLLRLGKVYTLQKGDGSIFDEMSNCYLRGETVKAAYDQIFTPIFLNDAVQAAVQLQKQNCRGIFNLCGSETVSRYDLAESLKREMKITKQLLKKISLDDLNEPFLRPKNTSMKNDKLMQECNLKMLSLNCFIQKIANNYSQQESDENAKN